MTVKILEYLTQSIPLIIALVIWAVHLEVKIARIQTDITWLKKELPGCLPPSDEPIP